MCSDEGPTDPECDDEEDKWFCKRNSKNCGWNTWVQEKCKKTCDKCSDDGPVDAECKDLFPMSCRRNARNCDSMQWMQEKCKKTCDLCTDEEDDGTYY